MGVFHSKERITLENGVNAHVRTLLGKPYDKSDVFSVEYQYLEGWIFLVNAFVGRLRRFTVFSESELYRWVLLSERAYIKDPSPTSVDERGQTSLPNSSRLSL